MWIQAGTDLSDAGGLGLGMACLLLVTAVVHAVHLAVRPPAAVRRS